MFHISSFWFFSPYLSYIDKSKDFGNEILSKKSKKNKFFDL